MNKLKKKILWIVYNVAKKLYIRDKFSKYGIIVETDDKIIVKVTQHKFNKRLRNDFALYCFGFSKSDEDTLGKIEELKPIVYEFDNITFPKIGAHILSGNADIIFSNCTFQNDLKLSCEKVTLQNNKYLKWYGSNQMINGWVKELVISGEDFVNSYENKDYGKQKFGIYIDGDKLKIINSVLEAESLGKIDLCFKESYIENSFITSPEVFIDSKSIVSDHVGIYAEKGIIIDNENRDFTGNLVAPVVVYNNEYLRTNNDDKKEVIIDSEDTELDIKRKELINVLKNLKNYCLDINNQKADKVRDSLNNKPISKILK